MGLGGQDRVGYGLKKAKTTWLLEAQFEVTRWKLRSVVCKKRASRDIHYWSLQTGGGSIVTVRGCSLVPWFEPCGGGGRRGHGRSRDCHPCEKTGVRCNRQKLQGSAGGAEPSDRCGETPGVALFASRTPTQQPRACTRSKASLCLCRGKNQRHNWHRVICPCFHIWCQPEARARDFQKLIRHYTHRLLPLLPQ